MGHRALPRGLSRRWRAVTMTKGRCWIYWVKGWISRGLFGLVLAWAHIWRPAETRGMPFSPFSTATSSRTRPHLPEKRSTGTAVEEAMSIGQARRIIVTQRPFYKATLRFTNSRAILGKHLHHSLFQKGSAECGAQASPWPQGPSTRYGPPADLFALILA